MASRTTAHQNIHGAKTVMPNGPALTQMIPPSEMQPGRTGKNGIRGVKKSKSPSTFLTAAS